jgi:methylmalonic aciduria homocystinuria type C protein
VSPALCSEDVSLPEWQQITERLGPACAEAGFDLLQPFAVASYNVVAEPTYSLPDFGRDDALGVVIGNTRELWPAFTRAREAPELRREAHPLDAYVARTLPRLVAAATPRPAELIFAHVTAPRPFPVQRVAESAGLAALAPSHLAIHPIYGPWFALRAVVIIDVPGPTTSRTAPRPCDTCSAPCVPALERALAASGPVLNGRSVSAHAQAWIAIRDACPVGPAFRYDEAQLRYHYGIDRSPPEL